MGRNTNNLRADKELSKAALSLLAAWDGKANSTADRIGLNRSYARRLAALPAFKRALQLRDYTDEMVQIKREERHGSVLTRAQLRLFWTGVILALPDFCTKKIVDGEEILIPPKIADRLKASELLARAKGMLKDVHEVGPVTSAMIQERLAQAKEQAEAARIAAQESQIEWGKEIAGSA